MGCANAVRMCLGRACHFLGQLGVALAMVFWLRAMLDFFNYDFNFQKMIILMMVLVVIFSVVLLADWSIRLVPV